jgi:hypothetical protein
MIQSGLRVLRFSKVFAFVCRYCGQGVSIGAPPNKKALQHAA